MNDSTVEIIAHCWNYDRLATLFLSQFALHPPHVPTQVTVCYSTDDERTSAVLREFDYILAKTPTVTLAPHVLETPRLLRRGIGRDECGRATTADFVLFADIDYLLGPGAVDAIAAEMNHARTLCGPLRLFFPRTAGWSSHEDGDWMIGSVVGPMVRDVDATAFTTVRMPKPIGGVQWTTGYVTRMFGYLPAGHRFLRPANVWRRTFEDSAARKWWGGNGVQTIAINVPNVWRVRHSKRGRFDVGVRL